MINDNIKEYLSVAFCQGDCVFVDSLCINIPNQKR